MAEFTHPPLKMRLDAVLLSAEHGGNAFLHFVSLLAASTAGIQRHEKLAEACHQASRASFTVHNTDNREIGNSILCRTDSGVFIRSKLSLLRN